TKKRALALITNCGTASNRVVYVAELAPQFPLDLGGTCGKLGRVEEEKSANSYGFYHAFENGFCKDYVTEKASRGYRMGSRPIMSGMAKYEEIFPPHSFINAKDFSLSETARTVFDLPLQQLPR
ncbi:hypothetical protein BV898_19999, partial [Hypsibius exemplaris]